MQCHLRNDFVTTTNNAWGLVSTHSQLRQKRRSNSQRFLHGVYCFYRQSGAFVVVRLYTIVVPDQIYCCQYLMQDSQDLWYILLHKYSRSDLKLITSFLKVVVLFSTMIKKSHIWTALLPSRTPRSVKYIEYRASYHNALFYARTADSAMLLLRVHYIQFHSIYLWTFTIARIATLDMYKLIWRLLVHLFLFLSSCFD